MTNSIPFKVRPIHLLCLDLVEEGFMENFSYYIRIKKEYACAIIEDLQLVEAIEILEDTIPEWQKEETLKRLKEMRANSSSVLSEEDFFKSVNADEKKA